MNYLYIVISLIPIVIPTDFQLNSLTVTVQKPIVHVLEPSEPQDYVIDVNYISKIEH